MDRGKVERLHSSLRKTAHKCRHLQMTHYQNNGDLRLLRIIAHNADGITPSQLAERLEVALPTVSQKLSVLERQRLIGRRTCEKDRRKIFVYATEKGVELVEADYQKFINSFSTVYERLGEEKAEQLTLLLNEISEYIDTEIHREGDTK